MKDFIEYLGKINTRKYLSFFLHLAVTVLFVYLDQSLLSAMFGSICTFSFVEAFREPMEKERDKYIENLTKGLENSRRKHKTALERRAEAVRINYPLDTQVIIKSANRELYKKGIVVGYELGFPVVRVGDKDLMVMGHIRRDNSTRNAALDKLDGIDQWNVMAENYVMKKD